MYKWAYFGGHQGKGIPLGRELKQEVEHEGEGQRGVNYWRNYKFSFLFGFFFKVAILWKSSWEVLLAFA